MLWKDLRRLDRQTGVHDVDGLHFAVAHCQANSCEMVWQVPTKSAGGGERSLLTKHASIIYPLTSTAPAPHLDLPEPARSLYIEASKVVDQSPRSAAALLRLATEQLVQHLTPNETGNLNSRIGKLAKSGLRPDLVNMLDALRVIGNNAVHPNEIVMTEEPGVASSLFWLINQITQALITDPVEIDKMYERLPEGARKAIEERDKR